MDHILRKLGVDCMSVADRLELIDQLWESLDELKHEPAAVAGLGLTPSERMELAGYLWDDLAENPGAVPVPDWHKRELDRRMAAWRDDPSGGLPWEEVKRRLRSRHGR